MRAGELRDRVRFEVFTGGVWALVATTSASVIPSGSAPAEPSLIPELLAPIPRAAYEIRVRYRSDLTETMRLRWGSHTLSITAPIVDPDNRRRELRIQAATIVSYIDRHAQALQALRAKGASVSFTVTPRTHTPSTDVVVAGTPQVLSGAAMRIDGDPKQYERLSLVETESPTLLFASDTYGGPVPALGAVTTFGGVQYVVKSVDPIAPDGVPIASRVVVAA